MVDPEPIPNPKLPMINTFGHNNTLNNLIQLHSNKRHNI